MLKLPIGALRGTACCCDKTFHAPSNEKISQFYLTMLHCANSVVSPVPPLDASAARRERMSAAYTKFALRRSVDYDR
jgi:hypothetical protein